MNLRFKRNQKLVFLTAFVFITLIAIAGSQPIAAYTFG